MKKLSIVKGIAGLAVMAAVFCGNAFSSLAAEGKVTAETAKIRASASTDSEVVGSTVKGKTIDILEAVKDSSGTVWYKVSVADGGYGYIRSDLVQTSEKIEVSTQTSSGSTQTGSQPAETVPTSIGEQQAVVKSGNNANVRSGASTQHSVVASLPGGTPITLIGEATDSAGNKWYQVTCSYNNKTVEGYVRSDLITMGAGDTSADTGTEGSGEGEDQDPSQGENPEDAGAAPEEGSEAPTPDEEHNDYKVVYTANSAGEQDYYLYLPDGESMIKVSELLNASETGRENNQKLQDQLDKEKIVIIILAVVIVLLFIVITVLLFKIRSLYYEDYEDEEEEEEEEEEPEPVRKKVRRRVAEEEESAPVPARKKRVAPSDEYERPAKPREKSGQPKAREEKELHAAERKEPQKKTASRKPQNFLIDDDEFEFEFLNMDDKDL
ncbi:MAG: SH3 domain-containing protein [Lachnospiraceae bacterium]|nr:SH3 domain-containing protein [Lachnospiraceae bacterium]